MTNEVAELQIAEQLPTDVMLMKMENEQMMSIAASRPRNIVAIKEQLFGELEAFPAAAGEAVYCKPVGKNRQGVMQYARNLSVRAAESIAGAYGFNRITADVAILDGHRAKITATFVDYTNARVWQDTSIVSKHYKGYDGDTRTHSEDRFWNVVVKAEKSRCIREAVMRCIPNALKVAYMQRCEELSGELLTDDKVKDIIKQFAGKGISQKTLEKTVIGRTLKEGWTTNDRRTLVQLWRGIESGEVSVSELGVGQAAPKPAEKKPETLDDLAKSKATDTVVVDGVFLKDAKQILTKAKDIEQLQEAFAALQSDAEARGQATVNALNEVYDTVLNTLTKE